MSWISEAHTQWHMLHGKNEVCPLDCGVGEDYYPDDYFDASITCGNCKKTHYSVQEVKDCYHFNPAPKSVTL